MNDKLKTGGLVVIIVIALAVVGMVAFKSAAPEKPNVVGTIKESDPAITGSQPGAAPVGEDPSTGAPAGAAGGATANVGPAPATPSKEPGNNF